MSDTKTPRTTACYNTDDQGDCFTMLAALCEELELETQDLHAKLETVIEDRREIQSKLDAVTEDKNQLLVTRNKLTAVGLETLSKLNHIEKERDSLRTQVAELEKERDEAVSEWRNLCDHEWELQDDSFDHEFGTEIIRSFLCEKCGASRQPETSDYDDEP